MYFGPTYHDVIYIVHRGKILNEFEQMNADEFEWSDEYKDDGFTGTGADREDFQRLLSDIHAGKVNCVIIKDGPAQKKPVCTA